jgi:hypothetical protein
MCTQENIPYQNRLPFSLLLSGACPDVNREANKRKEGNQRDQQQHGIQHKHFISSCLLFYTKGSRQFISYRRVWPSSGWQRKCTAFNPDSYRDDCAFPRPYRTVPARMICSGGRSGGFVTFFAQAKKVECGQGTMR